MGKNSIIIYFGDGFLPSILGDKYGQFAMIYWKSMQNNFPAWFYWKLLYANMVEPVAKFLFAFLDAWFWVGVGLVLYALGIEVRV